MIGFRGAAGSLNPWLCLGPEGTHPTLYASVLDLVAVAFSLPLEKESLYRKKHYYLNNVFFTLFRLLSLRDGAWISLEQNTNGQTSFKAVFISRPYMDRLLSITVNIYSHTFIVINVPCKGLVTHSQGMVVTWFLMAWGGSLSLPPVTREWYLRRPRTILESG